MLVIAQLRSSLHVTFLSVCLYNGILFILNSSLFCVGSLLGPERSALLKRLYHETLSRNTNALTAFLFTIFLSVFPLFCSQILLTNTSAATCRSHIPLILVTVVKFWFSITAAFNSSFYDNAFIHLFLQIHPSPAQLGTSTVCTLRAFKAAPLRVKEDITF